MSHPASILYPSPATDAPVSVTLSPDLLVTASGRATVTRLLQARGMSRSAARDAVKRLTIAATGERLARRHSLGIARTIPAWMGENPNDGKRHVARMNPTDQDIARQVARQTQPDTPVRVTEHRMTKRGTMSKRPTMRYTAMRSDYR